MVLDALELLYSFELTPEEERIIDEFWDEIEHGPEAGRAYWRGLQLAQEHRLREDALAMIWCLLTWQPNVATAEEFQLLEAEVEEWVREAERRRAEQLNT